MESSHPYYDEIIRNLVYKVIFIKPELFLIYDCQDVLNEEDIPNTESLKDLIEKRTVPFWKSVVEPQILGKMNIFNLKENKTNSNLQLEKQFYVLLMELP